MVLPTLKICETVFYLADFDKFYLSFRFQEDPYHNSTTRLIVMQWIQVTTPQQLQELNNYPGIPMLDIATFEQHCPDAHWVLLTASDAGLERVGRYSLWWKNTAAYQSQRVGYIGHYAVQDASDSVLFHACEQLQRQGCTMAIAPMDGNTWHSYRLVSDRGSHPPFFLEPNTPEEWLDQFHQAGFTSIADYSSALTTNLTQPDPRLDKVRQRLMHNDVTIHAIDLDQFETELQHIYDLCLISFRRNFLYTPISQTEFLQQYRQVQSYIKPDLVLLAKRDQQLVGFLFALPDWLEAQRGQDIQTVLIKTVAVLPERLYAGLGSVLVENCQAIAHQLGYTRAIHALMHDSNTSRNISQHYAQPIRRYSLMGKSVVSGQWSVVRG